VAEGCGTPEGAPCNGYVGDLGAFAADHDHGDTTMHEAAAAITPKFAQFCTFFVQVENPIRVRMASNDSAE
jgi:hypothetical protein